MDEYVSMLRSTSTLTYSFHNDKDKGKHFLVAFKMI